MSRVQSCYATAKQASPDRQKPLNSGEFPASARYLPFDESAEFDKGAVSRDKCQLMRSLARINDEACYAAGRSQYKRIEQQTSTRNSKPSNSYIYTTTLGVLVCTKLHYVTVCIFLGLLTLSNCYGTIVLLRYIAKNYIKKRHPYDFLTNTSLLLKKVIKQFLLGPIFPPLYQILNNCTNGRLKENVRYHWDVSNYKFV